MGEARTLAAVALMGGTRGTDEPGPVRLSMGWPDGTKTVFLTSRRPLTVPDLRGVAACCGKVSYVPQP